MTTTDPRIQQGRDEMALALAAEIVGHDPSGDPDQRFQDGYATGLADALTMLVAAGARPPLTPRTTQPRR